MSPSVTNYEHITIDENGVPIIAEANTKVYELVLDVMAHGSSPMELHFQYPHLTLGQIHSALAYYWDHKEAVDAEIELRYERVEQWRKAAGPSRLAARIAERRAA